MGIRRNIFLFKLYFLFANIWPLSALAIVFFQQITGSYAIALAVFSSVNIIQSIMSVPAGLVSDDIGRKKTMVLSSLCITTAFLMFAAAGIFKDSYLLIIGGIGWALANAFSAGTLESMMYETMDDLHDADEYDILYARSSTFGQIGLGLGALIGAIVVYFYSLLTLAWISVFFSIGQLIIALCFAESSKQIRKKASSGARLTGAVKAFIKNKKLRMITTLYILDGGIGNVTQRFEGAYFNMLIPTWMVNVARVTKCFCGAIGYYIAPFFHKFGFYRILVSSTIGMIVVKLIAVFMNSFATPFVQSGGNLFYGVTSTAESALLQQEFSDEQRATMKSMVSVLGCIVRAIMYFCIGLIADIYSVWWAMILLVFINVFIGCGYYWMSKKYKN